MCRDKPQGIGSGDPSSLLPGSKYSDVKYLTQYAVNNVPFDIVMGFVLGVALALVPLVSQADSHPAFSWVWLVICRSARGSGSQPGRLITDPMVRYVANSSIKSA